MSKTTAKSIFKLLSFNKKSTTAFFLWSSVVFACGFYAGFSSPTDKEEKIREYAIQLEHENSRIYKLLKSCNP